MKKILIHVCTLFIVGSNGLLLFSQESSLPTPQEWFLATGDWQNDPRIFVTQVGTGQDTVILLHGGWGGEHRGMLHTARGLEDRFHFVTYDQRGSLRSPFPDSLISLDQHIEDLERLRKELGISKIKLVGHSMGTFLAAAYHDRYPNRVKSLVLLAPARMKSFFPEEDMALFGEAGRRLELFRNRPEVEAELERMGVNKPDESLTSIERTIKFRISGTRMFLYDVSKWPQMTGGKPFYNPKVYQLTDQTMPQEGWDFIANFKSTEIPITIILGDHDFLDMGGHVIQKWVKGIPNVEVHLIENAAHDMWTDQPEVFRRLFLKALERK